MQGPKSLSDEILAVSQEIQVAFSTAYQIRESAASCPPLAISPEAAKFLAADANRLLPQGRDLSRSWKPVSIHLLAAANGRSEHLDALYYIQATAVAFSAECLYVYGEETKTTPVEVTINSVISRWPTLRQLLVNGVPVVGPEISNAQFSDRLMRIDVETAKAMQAIAVIQTAGSSSPIWSIPMKMNRVLAKLKACGHGMSEDKFERFVKKGIFRKSPQSTRGNQILDLNLMPKGFADALETKP